jgi:cyclase
MMGGQRPFRSDHFDVVSVGEGLFTCIHRVGGGALSNSGILDLGGRTLLIDAMGTLAAGRDLRAAAEDLFGRPVWAVILTHPHSDHWIGASALGAETLLLSSEACRAACVRAGAELVEDFRDRSAWVTELRDMEDRLQSEQDERVLAGLRKGVSHTRLVLAEMDDYEPRYADLTFKTDITLRVSGRAVEIHSLGRGHSTDDVVIFLRSEGIAFLGDVGFFGTQPFLADCDLEAYRRQLRFVLESDLSTLIPGHGAVGGRAEAEAQLAYMDRLEALVAEVVRRGGGVDEAKALELPPPYDAWLVGGMNRFAANVEHLYEGLSGSDKTSA